MSEVYYNYVDGDWVESETGDTFEVVNPADTTDVIGGFQRSSSDDATAAVEAAADAADEWADVPGTERGSILTEAARHMADRTDELTETLTREEGKTLTEAGAEVQRAVDIFEYYGQKAVDFGGEVKQPGSRDANLYTVEEPMGVAGLVTPWNYPVAIPAWKSAPALATGNTVVLKPANGAPNVFRKVVECLDEAGIPDGVVNYLTGPGSDVGGTIVDHDDVDVVSFTGSRSVGEMIHEQAGANQKRVQTEMGSKNTTVVMPSADLEEAAEIVGAGAFGVTGQACTGTERVAVHQDVHDEFLEELIAYADGLEIGPGLEDPDMGPHFDRDHLEGTLEYVERGRDADGTLAYGGEALEGGEYDDGHFVEPTIFTDVDSDAAIMQEEIFGPFVGVMSATDFEEAVELVNDVEFGLSTSIVTRDHAEANRFRDAVDFGIVKINEKTTGLQYYVPFGGMNASSSETFREQGDAAIDFYTITKTVYENYGRR
ncbi:2,5-dioxovalerate dehydrogenase [Natrarchaeobius chitinivorans]|uniref:Aldehyde dehydrogenase family protein n=1 Tax=Natrarchaeobius chitinivorans TaxID=1679083 RepID=A0A3N6M8T2_NATCH|nr:aldehyde dehydrogenase family protein [Natrarchaeobius chitinivorans]RQG97084.1 aldehyde dehydrogenase family protein [Natrarchaeobius chitinivorans]